MHRHMVLGCNFLFQKEWTPLTIFENRICFAKNPITPIESLYKHKYENGSLHENLDKNKTIKKPYVAQYNIIEKLKLSFSGNPLLHYDKNEVLPPWITDKVKIRANPINFSYTKQNIENMIK